MPIAGAVGAGFKEPLVHAPGNGASANYKYRQGLGMMASAEFNVFHDDFVKLVSSNVPAGWAAAVIDDSATVATDTTLTISGGTGVLKFLDADASEGAAIYMPKSIILTAGKKFFMEVRVRTNDVTDNVFQFGLTDLTATTNPEDLWTTTAANLITFGILDGSATTKYLVDTANGGTAAGTGDLAMVADTWHKLAIYYDGVAVRGFVDGAQSFRTTTTIPVTIALAPFIGFLNGNGAGGNLNFVDYVRFSQER